VTVLFSEDFHSLDDDILDDEIMDHDGRND
jgi:hypothetical protein